MTVVVRVPVLLPAGDRQLVLTGSSGETAATTATLRSLLGEPIDPLRALLGGWPRATDPGARRHPRPGRHPPRTAGGGGGPVVPWSA